MQRCCGTKKEWRLQCAVLSWTLRRHSRNTHPSVKHYYCPRCFCASRCDPECVMYIELRDVQHLPQLCCASCRVAPRSSPGCSRITAGFSPWILRLLAFSWTIRGLGSACDALQFTCLAYADDVMLFAVSLAHDRVGHSPAARFSVHCVKSYSPQSIGLLDI